MSPEGIATCTNIMPREIVIFLRYNPRLPFEAVAVIVTHN